MSWRQDESFAVLVGRLTKNPDPTLRGIGRALRDLLGPFERFIDAEQKSGATRPKALASTLTAFAVFAALEVDGKQPEPAAKIVKEMMILAGEFAEEIILTVGEVK